MSFSGSGPDTEFEPSIMHRTYSLDLVQIILWSGAAAMLFGYIAWRGIKGALGHFGGGDVIALEDGGGGHGGGDCGGGGDGGGCH